MYSIGVLCLDWSPSEDIIYGMLEAILPRGEASASLGCLIKTKIIQAL